MTNRTELCARVRQLKAELDAAEAQMEDAFRPLMIERLRAGDEDGAKALLRELPDGIAKIDTSPRMVWPEDVGHDWSWSRGKLRYNTMTTGGRVWLLLEYDEAKP